MASITTAKRAFFFVHTAGPNMALIKSSGRRNMRVVIGGRIFSIPGMERVDTLSLELRTITVFTKGGLTINGVSVDVTSACQVKIQGWTSNADATGGGGTHSSPRPSSALGGQSGMVHLDEGAIRLAAQHFLGKSDQEIEDCIQATISGHQRSIIGCLTLEQLYRDRAAFCKRVLELSSVDMRNMGLAVVSYTVADITDENGYINALGVTQTEAVKREAVEGAARNQSAAKSIQAQEEAAAHIEVNLQVRRKVESDLQLHLEQTKAQEMIQRQTAVQSKAHDISDAEQDAILLVTRQKAAAAETKAQLEVIRQEVEKEKLMKMKAVNVEADAMLYRAKLTADCTRATAAAEAERVRELGKAEAESIRQKGLAEVEVLRFRNRAWQESVNPSAILEKMIEILPEVAGAIAKPLQNTEKMVFVNSTSGGGGGGDTGSGLAAFAKDFKRVVAEVPEVVNALTGINLQTSIQQLTSSSTGTSIMQGVAEGLSSSIAQTNLASHDEARIRTQYSYNDNSRRNSSVGNVQ